MIRQEGRKGTNFIYKYLKEDNSLRRFYRRFGEDMH